MNRPYVNFRPSQEMLDDITAIGKETDSTTADVTRQLAAYGLERYKDGDFQIIKRTRPGSKKLDKRFLRKCGQKISKKRAGRPIKFSGDSNETPHPPTPDRLLDKPAGAISND